MQLLPSPTSQQGKDGNLRNVKMVTFELRSIGVGDMKTQGQMVFRICATVVIGIEATTVDVGGLRRSGLGLGLIVLKVGRQTISKTKAAIGAVMEKMMASLT
jgi:hypothetical protein